MNKGYDALVLACQCYLGEIMNGRRWSRDGGWLPPNDLQPMMQAAVATAKEDRERECAAHEALVEACEDALDQLEWELVTDRTFAARAQDEQYQARVQQLRAALALAKEE